jgi:sulfite reductase (ferredoxin)
MEELKANSRYLRGTLAGELRQEGPFTKGATGILKFHGAYQQDDRDARKQGPKQYTVMVRVSIPGGVLRAEQYLALDKLSDSIGDQTLRITSRGGIQYHYVGKTDLARLIRGVNEAGLMTWAACGDVVRNVVCCAAPFETGARREVESVVRTVNRELKPRTRAYAEIWLNGEKAASLETPREEADEEPLYGATYLPRKFKIGFAYEGENTTDIYGHDLGLVAHGDPLEGFTVLAGGGMGQTNGMETTYPRLGSVIGFIAPDRVLEVAKAAITIHRDFGDRENRKHARLKYVIEERGVDWFRDELESRLGWTIEAPRPLAWHRHGDYLGWHRQSDSRWFYGLRVLNGRVAGALRVALRRIVEELKPEVRCTAQQNLLFAGLTEAQKPRLDALLAEYRVPSAAALPPVLRHSMACVALPTCGLALAEGERALPGVAEQIQAEFDRAGLGGQLVQLRMTGCPNGCARPYTAEIGVVGLSPGLYSIYLGGSPMATRLASPWLDKVPLANIGSTLRPLIEGYARQRSDGESFGDWCARNLKEEENLCQVQ